MTNKSAGEIRSAFLNFFREKNHLIVPSSPVVVKNDPTLMFTNAGMNQFKDYFLGNKKAPAPRIADTQKCLRVSGKHNDLEEVGVDTYHHTLFEMLGNWSFGDYFKEEAIDWAWEFLTEVLTVDKERLYATVFEGDATDGTEKDNEALAFWKKHLPEDRILFGNKKDNFWEMGDTGPCGPCTELHIDSRPDEEREQILGRDLVNQDHDQVIEIWNIVFIQFDRKKDGSLQLLKNKHVDTGMGFERLVRVIQQKTSNYDTDVFTPTIQAIEKITGTKYDGSNSKEAIAIRVLSDHIRAVSFAIADGQLPSNTGAGYVIRRILRRAVRYYFSSLNQKQPMLHQLVDVISEQFKEVFPELKKQEIFVKKVILEEESNFLHTLEAGLRRMDVIIKETSGQTISGYAAFELFDTYGFPLDLTRLVAAERQLDIDEKGFEEEMEQQKARSRAATEVDMSDWVILDTGRTTFKGYTTLQTESKLLRYRKVKTKGKELYQLVLDQTPFYAESGGQVGDRGILYFGDEAIEVVDTKKDLDLIVHFTKKFPSLPDDIIHAKVDIRLRKETTLHHSVTHLMHAALRTVLGKHVEQRGSLNDEEHLRFDFSHFAKMTAEEILQVENIVNDKILENVPVVIKELPKEEALKLGAMALFGEKYGDIVRVVIMDPNFSIELCGGTHVANTGEIGMFKIISESATAAGIRRIEAVAGHSALAYFRNKEAQLESIAEMLKNPQDIQKALQQILSENDALKKEVGTFQNERQNQTKQSIKTNISNINGVNYWIGELEGWDVNASKNIATELRKETNTSFFVIVGQSESKPFITVAISDDLVADKKLNAGQLVREWAKAIQGGGGGQAFIATAGGKNPDGIQQVISTAKNFIKDLK
ncbi:MAG: alanine--tRNA ligase [Chitinophagales bacterium]|nr:alanine--tRNA ligase [Chitinophagales bacterium]